MTEPEAPPIILPPDVAKRRFTLYLVVKLGGLGLLFAGVALSRHGFTVVSAVVLLVGTATLFIRPHMLGLTKKP